MVHAAVWHNKMNNRAYFEKILQKAMSDDDERNAQQFVTDGHFRKYCFTNVEAEKMCQSIFDTLIYCFADDTYYKMESNYIHATADIIHQAIQSIRDQLLAEYKQEAQKMKSVKDLDALNAKYFVFEDVAETVKLSDDTRVGQEIKDKLSHNLLGWHMLQLVMSFTHSKFNVCTTEEKANEHWLLNTDEVDQQSFRQWCLECFNKTKMILTESPLNKKSVELFVQLSSTFSIFCTFLFLCDR